MTFKNKVNKKRTEMTELSHLLCIILLDVVSRQIT